MKIKKFLMFILIICLIFVTIPIGSVEAKTHAQYIDGVIGGMKGVNQGSVNTGSGIGKVINIVIRLIQVAGSGISLIMVTILGIKYMLASAGEKADLKKQAIPIVTGCIILFAAVNIAGIIANFGEAFNT